MLSSSAVRLLLLLGSFVALPPIAAAGVPTPSVEGPITGGAGQPLLVGTSFDLAAVGYQQEEFFVSGIATAHAAPTPLTADGAWSVTPAATLPYRTRVIVYRPVQPGKFRGSIAVEWLNVTGGIDTAIDWIQAHTELIRRRWIWVGVSAQEAGVETGGGALTVVDPARYGSLHHPGDSFSYDIFSQVARALRPGGGLLDDAYRPTRRLIATGHSQSAARMVTYVNAVHPLAGVYDGFLVHGRPAGAAPLSQAPEAAIPAPVPAFIRGDSGVPVLTFQTETDVVTLQSFLARQPDDERQRLWEVAGTAHIDTYLTTVGPSDPGGDPGVADLVVTTLGCNSPVNSGPQHWVLKAAFAAMDRWVRRGTAPAPAPRLEAVADPAIRLERDVHGNALGGIRTPAVDVPIATLTGVGQTGGSFCFLLGTTTPFDRAMLGLLYPTRSDYLRASLVALRTATRGKYVLRPDAKLLKTAALLSGIGQP